MLVRKYKTEQQEEKIMLERKYKNWAARRENKLWPSCAKLAQISIVSLVWKLSDTELK